MTKELTVGNKTFNFPSQGTSAPWGEEATDWAEAVTDSLTGVQGPNDILITSATLANDQSSAANIPGLSFTVASIISADIDYTISRTYNDGGGDTTLVERGKIYASYNGTTFDIIVRSSGDESGVTITALDTGQFQYTSDDKSTHGSMEIKFRAATVDV